MLLSRIVNAIQYPIGLQFIVPSAEALMAGPEDPIGSNGPPPARTPARTKRETLSYVTDIIEELKRLADKSGYRTLGVILAAALAEARLQSEEAEQ